MLFRSINREDQEIYFGEESGTHNSVSELNCHYDKTIEKYVLKNGCTSLSGDQGRIWVSDKIISFWSLETSNITLLLKDIQDSFNNEHSETSIDFFNDLWKIEIDYDERYKVEPHNDYLGRKKIIIPLLRYIEMNKNESEIEEDDEEYQQHLAKQKAKNDNKI